MGAEAQGILLMSSVATGYWDKVLTLVWWRVGVRKLASPRLARERV